ncbi:MAG: M28 family peptidase [Candidatus Aminicenantes bacterium]|nr:M28 family peptidase [Candidatus Aminicenantes bacterium]
MTENDPRGWPELLAGYPWFEGKGRFPLAAYSEYMPGPFLGRKPLGRMDHGFFPEADPCGWPISELEEEVELKPGIRHIGHQIMSGLINLGQARPAPFIHGHGGQNLKGNPYWPPELAGRAGTLAHERYVALLPLMLSRTQDDKGRLSWTFFGNSLHEPERTFWKGFFTAPGKPIPGREGLAFFRRLINAAYGAKIDDEKALFRAGFRILPGKGDFPGPGWARPFLVKDAVPWTGIRYLLTFRPFRFLPAPVKDLYLAGRIALLPFPGSLVFWGMPNYLKLQKAWPIAGQIPLLTMVSRRRGPGGVRVAQSGWLHEPHPKGLKHELNKELVLSSFGRTHRWQRVHRHQDELNTLVRNVKIAKALFSTEAKAMGLYDKPLARNCQLWNHQFERLLDGPKADREAIRAVEKTMLKGGLFGYRFFYPPMRVGAYQVYLHRPLVAFLSGPSGEVEVQTDGPGGYLAAYHDDDAKMSQPVELWPRVLDRPLHRSALAEFSDGRDQYAYQTARNILSLLESRSMLGGRPLARSFALRLLDVSPRQSLEPWLEGLGRRGRTAAAGRRMKSALNKTISSRRPPDPAGSLTFAETATRAFEEAWWDDVRLLSQGRFVYKDNADIPKDRATRRVVDRKSRDLENLGDYLLERHRKAIAAAGLAGTALCGELPFPWRTDFDYPIFGGWTGNQKGRLHERNILVVIPGRDRSQAVVLADHYDTAYMEDVYAKGRGGCGPRLAARGADDNSSAGATLLQAAPILLRLSKAGKLKRDVWLLHLTGEEFPADCMGSRNFCRTLIEKTIRLKTGCGRDVDLSKVEVVGAFVMDMIGHNRDDERDVFQISPGTGAASLRLARQAHEANRIWNALTLRWNKSPARRNLGRGRRISGKGDRPIPARHLALQGQVRTPLNPRNSLFNTDGQIFSDVGVPVVLLMENYDINRTGYHDSRDTMEGIDLDYGSALAAIAIETTARVAGLTRLK